MLTKSLLAKPAVDGNTVARMRSQTGGRFDQLRGLCHGGNRRLLPSMGPVKSSESSDDAVVHVVDDDTSLAAALESLFETVGLAARTYPSARDFLGSGLTDNPGCIVIDIRLPDINGLEFQEQLTR